MDDQIVQISAMARKAVQSRDWGTVDAGAKQILRLDTNSPEGHFLSGLVAKAGQKPKQAAALFENVLGLDAARYDAAIELASQYVMSLRNSEAIELLTKYIGSLDNSPRYLDMAGTIYADIGLSDRAWPLYKKANQLQPNIDLFQANLAACSVFLGKIDEANAGFQGLLAKHPNHQRNHYQLSRLEKAKDSGHIEQMKKVLATTNLPPGGNIFIYYALGKELEDLEYWRESFHYYKLAGDAVTSVSGYDVINDERLMEKIIEVCNADWCATRLKGGQTAVSGKTPIFIVGLPRTGTTLTERILASHSQVESVGETQYMESVLRRESGVASLEKMLPEMIESLATKDISSIADGYLNAVSYLLGDKPLFIDKLPYNYLYLGFIAKAYPSARIVRLKRNPMDACFAMYKQPFTWAYKFSYTLADLGRYYVAYERLFAHWREVLRDRLVEIEYELLVSDQESQTRQLLSRLGLDFEQACLDFDQNTSISMTASSVQIREKIHSRSVLRWKCFEEQLSPLRDQLVQAGIDVD